MLDLPVDAALTRLATRQAEQGVAPDRFERDDVGRHEARRQAFLAIAEREAQRCVVVDAAADEETVAAAVLAAVETRLLTVAD